MKYHFCGQSTKDGFECYFDFVVTRPIDIHAWVTQKLHLERLIKKSGGAWMPDGDDRWDRMWGTLHVPEHTKIHVARLEGGSQFKPSGHAKVIFDYSDTSLPLGKIQAYINFGTLETIDLEPRQ